MKKISAALLVLVFLNTISFAQSSASTDNSRFTLGNFAGLNIPRLSGGNG